MNMCLGVIAKHMTQEKAVALLSELAEVPGNASFAQTVATLAQNARAGVGFEQRKPGKGKR